MMIEAFTGDWRPGPEPTLAGRALVGATAEQPAAISSEATTTN